MPIEDARTGPINEIPTTRRLRTNLAEAAQRLTFINLWRVGTIAEEEEVRIDVQGVWRAGPGFNIQAQVGRATIAAIRLARTLEQAEGAENEAAVVAAVTAALITSAAEGEWHDVTGEQP